MRLKEGRTVFQQSGYPWGIWNNFFYNQVISVQTGIKNTNLKPLPCTPGPGKVCPEITRIFSLRSSLLKTIFLTLLLALILLPDVSGQWLDGYCYRKQITIQESQIPDGSDFTDFPVLISVSLDNDLRDEFNGGYVNNSNGWDLVFTSSDGEARLDHEVEKYVAATGEYVAWVKIPTLDHNDNTIIYLYFGYDTPASDPSTANTWSNGFVSVYHLHDDEDDALGANDGTSIGTVNETGRVLDAEDFERGDNTDRIELGNFDISTSAITISAWVRPESFAITDARIVSKATGSVDAEHWWMLSTIGDGSELRFRLKTGGTTSTYNPGVSVLNTGTWSYVTAVYDGSNMNLYHNGAVVGSGSGKTGNISTSSLVDVAIGNQPASAFGDGERPFDGRIDEVRIASTSRSGDWLTTEYNNQNSPGTFYSLGTQQTAPLNAYAGIDDDVCGSFSYTLSATPSIGDGLWTLVSGPGSVTSWGTGQTSPSTMVTVDDYGTYTFEWAETVGTCSDADSVDIDFFKKPIGQSTPATQILCSGNVITTIVLSTTNGMDGVTTYAWSRDNTTNVTGLA
ncbi:MAG: DUF2341 domain-containing protein, partial [Bacteroidales bacterium]|nr:DUF2341 domain-containing protein [Bacteroidales bacterium]